MSVAKIHRGNNGTYELMELDYRCMTTFSDSGMTLTFQLPLSPCRLELSREKRKLCMKCLNHFARKL